MTNIDFEKADKKMTKLEQYWMNQDLSYANNVQQVGQQITQGRQRLINKLIEKLPEKEVMKDSIERFREGSDIDEDVQVIVDECEEMIQLAEKHPYMFNLVKRLANTNSIFPIIKNQTDPSSILVHLQCYKPDVYKMLLSEVGGFEYIKILTMRVWNEIKDDVEELDRELQQQVSQGQVQQQPSQSQMMGNQMQGGGY